MGEGNGVASVIMLTFTLKLGPHADTACVKLGPHAHRACVKPPHCKNGPRNLINKMFPDL